MRCIVLCGLLAAVWSTGAVATGGGHHDDDAELNLLIVGKVSPKCEISLPNKSIKTTLTDGPGSESVAFSVKCNQKLSVVMTSANGGFEHPTRDRNQSFDGFTNFLPYQATFSVNANHAQPVVAQSEAMLGGAGGSIGVVPHTATGTLQLSWQPEQPLLGGVYEDVIEIRVTGAG